MTVESSGSPVESVEAWERRKVRGRDVQRETDTALRELVEAVSNQIPANPENPKFREMSDAMERDLAKYFQDLLNAFPFHKLAAIYSKYAEIEE